MAWCSTQTPQPSSQYFVICVLWVKAWNKVSNTPDTILRHTLKTDKPVCIPLVVMPIREGAKNNLAYENQLKNICWGFSNKLPIYPICLETVLHCVHIIQTPGWECSVLAWFRFLLPLDKYKLFCQNKKQACFYELIEEESPSLGGFGHHSI